MEPHLGLEFNGAFGPESALNKAASLPSQAPPSAKTAGDYAWLSIPFGLRILTSKNGHEAFKFALSMQMLVFIYPIQDTSVCLGSDKK